MTDEYATATRFQSRPQIVEAIRWTGENGREILRTVPDKTAVEVEVGFDGEEERAVLRLQAGVDGCQGWVYVPVGHWLVHSPGDLSDVWPVEDNYFRDKYVPHYE